MNLHLYYAHALKMKIMKTPASQVQQIWLVRALKSLIKFTLSWQEGDCISAHASDLRSPFSLALEHDGGYIESHFSYKTLRMEADQRLRSTILTGSCLIGNASTLEFRSFLITPGPTAALTHWTKIPSIYFIQNNALYTMVQHDVLSFKTEQ